MTSLDELAVGDKKSLSLVGAAELHPPETISSGSKGFDVEVYGLFLD